MSAKINISNYEAFVLDFMEGNLSQEDILLLKTFVLTHPELDIDLNDTELVSLEIDSVLYNNKENLKKTSPLLSDEQFVDYIENNLNNKQKAAFEKTIAADKFLQKELEVYKRTVLVADNSIVFEDKASLKREAKVLWFQNTSYLSMAAAILLIFGLWFTFKDSFTTNETKPNNVLSLSKNVTKIISPAVKEEISVPENTVGVINEAPKQFASNTSNKAINKKKSESPSVKNNIDPVTSNNIPEQIVAKNNTAIKRLEILPAKKDSIQNGLAYNSKPSSSNFIVAVGRDEDEAISPKVENKSIWARAGKALHNLNKLGVKKVNGAEEVENNKEEYVLSLGNFSIKQNKYTQN